jgi:hypothetical protein
MNKYSQALKFDHLSLTLVDMQIKQIKEKYQPNNPEAFKDLENSLRE